MPLNNAEWAARAKLLTELWGSRGINQMKIHEARHGETLIIVPKDIVAQVQQWLTEQFGPGGNRRKYRWRRSWTNTDVFYVRDTQIATLFALKWAGNNT
jgi:hypothetical protein